MLYTVVYQILQRAMNIKIKLQSLNRGLFK